MEAWESFKDLWDAFIKYMDRVVAILVEMFHLDDGTTVKEDVTNG